MSVRISCRRARQLAALSDRAALVIALADGGRNVAAAREAERARADALAERRGDHRRLLPYHLVGTDRDWRSHLRVRGAR